LTGIEKILGIKPLVTQLPLGEESSFRGIINLITMKALVFSNDTSGKFVEENIPEDMQSQAEEFRSKMIEDIAESSDELLEKYLEGTPCSMRFSIKKYWRTASFRLYYQLFSFTN